MGLIEGGEKCAEVAESGKDVQAEHLAAQERRRGKRNGTSLPAPYPEASRITASRASGAPCWGERWAW